MKSYLKQTMHGNSAYSINKGINTRLAILRGIVLLLMLSLLIPATGYSQGDTTKNKETITQTDPAKDVKNKQVRPPKNPEKTTNEYVYVYIGFSAICAVCLLISGFIIYATNKSPADVKFALGLPDGSIRAIIAIMAIIFYILVSVTMSIFNAESTIATDVTKTLGTLVVAISAFYFGSKTAEQSSKAVTDTLTGVINNTTDPAAVPVAIIQQAIAANKEKWLPLYQCEDIKLGKKMTQDTTHNLDCIVFVVKTKDVTADTKVIPPYITYNSQGKDYNIPTDVQVVGS